MMEEISISLIFGEECKKRNECLRGRNRYKNGHNAESLVSFRHKDHGNGFEMDEGENYEGLTVMEYGNG